MNSCKLDEIANLNPKIPNKEEIRSETEVSFIPMKCVQEKSGKFSYEVKPFGDIKSRYKEFMDGDVLFAKITPCMENGKIAVMKGLKNGIGFGSTEFHVLRPTGKVDKDYLFYYLIQDWLRGKAKMKMTGAVGQKRVPKKVLANFKIPLPSKKQQKRIVARIEELFSTLDNGVANLQKARQQLNTYRQSVLKAAFEGKLTNEASDGELPQSWSVEKVENVGEVVTGTTPSKKKKQFYGGEYPLFKPTDLNKGYYVKKAHDHLSEQGIKKARLLPKKSILVTCIGATIGKTGFIRKEGASNQQINAIIPNEKVIPEFGYFYCISKKFQEKINEKSSATTMPILNKTKFKGLPFVLPSLQEQKQIVREIEHRLSVTDQLVHTIDTALQKSESLRQSILKSAFEGRLVKSGVAEKYEQGVEEFNKAAEGEQDYN